MGEFHAGLRELYEGHGRTSLAFRSGLIGFDLVAVGYFLVSATLPPAPWMRLVDLAIGLPILFDLLARTWLASDRRAFLLRVDTAIDLMVVLSLAVTVLGANLTFLRVFRALRLLRSYELVRELRDTFGFFRQNAEVVQSSINLVVFIFVISSLVFVLQHETNPDIGNWVDALYFTVTTLTTTGFGDITLQGTGGRLLAVAIMVVGVSLFLRLLQTLFRPDKVEHECPDCGLVRHDRDAVHCKHCGRVLHIVDEGEP